MWRLRGTSNTSSEVVSRGPCGDIMRLALALQSCWRAIVELRSKMGRDIDFGKHGRSKMGRDGQRCVQRWDRDFET